MKSPGNEPDSQLWASLLRHMRSTRPDICRHWFDQLEPLGVAGGVLRVRAHSPVHRDYLQRACVGPFNDAAQVATGHLISVRFYGLDEPVEVRIKDPQRGGQPNAQPVNPSTQTPPATGSSDGHRGTSNGETEGNGFSTGSPQSFPSSLSGEVQIPDGMRGFLPNAGQPVEAGERIYDDGLVLNPDYAFDNFVMGPGNRLAHSAALAVASGPGSRYNPLFVHGGVGLGKTHLLQAICLAIRAQRPEAVIYYTSCEGFYTQFTQSVRQGAMHLFRHKFRHVDVLVVDDIHDLRGKEKTQEEFFHTFNALHQNKKQVVLSSDAPPSDIPELEERLMSRFKMGLVVEVSPPDHETRVQILLQKAQLRGFEMPEEVAQRVAQRINTNIRELEGAVTKLQMMATVEKRDIDLDMVRRALGEQQSTDDSSVQISTIFDLVSDFFGVKMVEMQSQKRQRSVALPRQVCMYLARRHTRFSLEEIGGYFGGRDHTTVMHAVRIITQRAATDAEFAQQIEGLEARLKG